MKKFIIVIFFFGILFTQGFARGGHTGIFQRVERDPATGKRVVIEFCVGAPHATDPEERTSWKRIIAVDGNGKWDRLEVPIYVNSENKPLTIQNGPLSANSNDSSLLLAGACAIAFVLLGFARSVICRPVHQA